MLIEGLLTHSGAGEIAEPGGGLAGLFVCDRGGKGERKRREEGDRGERGRYA